MADPVVPLASLADFKIGAFSDLVADYPDDAVLAALGEGTRVIEGICNRRFAPFTITETVRVAALKPDEAAAPGTGGAPSPWPGGGVTSSFFADGSTGNTALWPPPASGVDWQLVRHVWLCEKPPRYQEMWTWNVASIVTRGGSAPGTVITTILDGPDEAGHLWFLPPGNLLAGSRVAATYSAGYAVAVPAELVRANKYITASIIVRELNPDDVQHDPDALYNSGLNVLAQGNWIRDHPAPGLRVLP